jgi:Ala-tRNA(Pro) deacylase
MASDLLGKIRAFLDEAGTARREVSHGPTATSEESARARGEDLRIGGKALVIKVGDEFHLLVLSAELAMDSAAVKAHFGVKKFRFATPEELVAMGLQIGAVPPFGPPLLPLPLHVDPSVLANDVIAFNAGSLTDSMVIGTEDYRRLARPHVFRFAKALDREAI